MKIIFTADLHGNIHQFELLFKTAEEYDIDTVIIGGDIFPKGINGSIEGQKSFLNNELIPLIKRNQLKKHYNILIILGNDDWACCLDELKKHDNNLFNLIHMKKIKLGRFNFIGYPFSPVSPFGIKDWEKWDNKEQSLEYIRLEGVKSKGNNLIKFRFDPADRSDSIKNDLKKLLTQSDPKNTIYVFHTPPFNTCLDMISENIHIGSKAVRTFIEKNQPFLTLHGHIHESIDISENFTDKIGKTKCAGIGNYHDRSGLAIIILDTENLKNIKRVIVF